MPTDKKTTERRPQISFPVDEEWKKILHKYMWQRSMEEGKKITYVDLMTEAFTEVYGIDFTGGKKKKMRKIV